MTGFRGKQFVTSQTIWAAAILGLFALTYHGFTGSVVDEAMPIGVTAQLVTAHTFQINPLYPALKAWGAPDSNPDTPIYSKYAPGQSLLALPFYALGSLVPNRTITHAPDGTPFLPAAPILVAWLVNSLATLLA